MWVVAEALATYFGVKSDERIVTEVETWFAVEAEVEAWFAVEAEVEAWFAIEAEVDAWFAQSYETNSGAVQVSLQPKWRLDLS